jgi:hypothetical protein
LGKLHQIGALAELDYENAKEMKLMEMRRKAAENEENNESDELMETEREDDVFPDLIASYCHFQRSVQLGSIEGNFLDLLYLLFAILLYILPRIYSQAVWHWLASIHLIKESLKV